MDDILGAGMELDDTTLGAFVHTTHKALEEVYDVAGIDQHSCVIDIGCGDGRAAIVAASHNGCRTVGGIDIGEQLIEKFHVKATSKIEQLREAAVKAAADESGVEASIASLPKCICVYGDALHWGKQERLFLSEEEMAAIPEGTSVLSKWKESEFSAPSDVFLPRPTHIYLYILQHMLKHLVPLLKRIRREVPGVVIISAFEFKVRPLDGSGEDGDVQDEDYLDVPVSELYLESKRKLTFRIYK